MDLLDLGRIVVGLVLLVLGGEVLVKGASALALRLGFSSLVVGLTVVAASTSAPELSVAVGSVLRGVPGLTVGNVVGANVLNVWFILGITALIVPLTVSRSLLRVDLPVMLALTAGLLLLSLDGRLGRLDGVLLCAVTAAHVAAAVIISRREARASPEAAGVSEAVSGGKGADSGAPPAPVPVAVAVVLVAGGVALLVTGATVLIDGAVSIATGLGVSSLLVGLTIVSVGTTLPELTTSVIAVMHRKHEMAVGVAVGSCIFNIGVVLGIPAALLGGMSIPDTAVVTDMPVMLAAAAALLLTAFTDATVTRRKGALFLVLYAAYTGFLVLDATQHESLEVVTIVLAWVVLPMTVVVLVVGFAREAGQRRRGRQAR